MHLLVRQHLYLRVPLRRQSAFGCRIFEDEPFIHRFVQRRITVCMNRSKVRIGYSVVIQITSDEPSVSFQICIERLQVVRFQLVQRYVTDIRNDLLVDKFILG